MGSLADLVGKSVCFDANVFIYALDDLPPWNIAAGSLLRAAEAGEFAAVTSELTLAECLVKPLQTGSQASVRVYEQAIRPRRWLTVVPVSREVLIEPPGSVRLALPSCPTQSISLRTAFRKPTCSLPTTRRSKAH